MNISLKPGQKVFFASDFHLGAPDPQSSKKREEKIIRWLNSIEKEAAALFLVGDVFDFWFEYDKVIPKGFIRFMGKIADLRDKGIPIIFFTGNHDLWMKDYFTQELDVPVYGNPIQIKINDKKFLVGHGDGLGPGDKKYKVLKKVFTNEACQWFFKWLHPDIGIRIAQKWSGSSRITNMQKNEDQFKGEDEWLWQYCKQVENQMHHDFYIFGHRHLPLELPVGERGKYYNLGEWVSQYTYGEFDGEEMSIKSYKF
ncbi:UDP-2,3-diacylglucosamine diphosphatase [Litoribacter ruber]|uniref:UDP-2,3-diacylglucosamine diphosphatase n=1 Tax=Litoribacter ruber TaxID=702568 RepID=A0AAP2CGZ4_9BACT|nr:MULTISPECIES: UDP-2,3-diacylglucosamine diphosphatase [Litoribacter]MBS9523031.1 UDP-2,3-diacylglucosamine diphosphatase [Litoribacter alkaliphilus]MBT0810805.1 UDP-2,3-diacylglucosamine diphosphatase [Litoribacter ruber]